jgi:hypothetical protein
MVGGGNTGVEVVTELAERYPGLQITLVTRRSFARNLSATAQAHIRKAFDRLGVTFRENTTVTQLNEDCALTEQGETIPFDVCIWVGGFAVSNLRSDPGARQLVDNHRDRPRDAFVVASTKSCGWRCASSEELARRCMSVDGDHNGAHADCLAAQPMVNAVAFGLSYFARGPSDGEMVCSVSRLDTPLNVIVTGRLASMREFFVHFALGPAHGAGSLRAGQEQDEKSSRE